MRRYINPRIIGGMFGLVQIELVHTAPPFLTGTHLLMANARSGIWLLVQQLRPSQVWLPSYLCDSILKAIDQTVTTIQFYEVDETLQLSSQNWLAQIKPEDLVVFIDYFGFPVKTFWKFEAKKRQAWVLEDASQALLSTAVRQYADFVLYSPRKFLGVPDGGILINNFGIGLKNENLCLPPNEWWLKSFKASLLRREFDTNGNTREWFDLFKEIERDSPIGSYAMSQLSQLLLSNAVDYRRIIQKRTQNYRTLHNELQDFALFPVPEKGVVPLGYPIRLKNRDEIRQKLFQYEIFPPVHWPIQDIVPTKYQLSHQLAAEIMTLPCDQRYDKNDMLRLAEIILREIDT